jgi:hypothetical protein
MAGTITIEEHIMELTVSPRSELSQYEWDNQTKHWIRPKIDKALLKKLTDWPEVITSTWLKTYLTQIGAMSAEMLLANWVTHDYLHMRQILSLKYGYLAQQVMPISLEYAGTW